MSRREPPVDLVDLILQAHEALEQDGMPHAFGGALALADSLADLAGSLGAGGPDRLNAPEHVGLSYAVHGHVSDHREEKNVGTSGITA